ncbi:MAG: type 1 glutamine amidotransferase [Chloroflexi bacterium]|nr:type 1 glutamine amidotransferase [Chloroflexota bacterium]
MKTLIFQQVESEGPGLFGEFLKRWGIPFDIVAFYRRDSVPLLSDYDALLVLGGPMNVYEEDRYPFLAEENLVIKDVVRQGKPYLGICLGAQLLAKALGAKVAANPVKEIGFSHVQLTPDAAKDGLFKGLGTRLPVFQWHGDTFSIPEGAVKLAESQDCPNQAFVYGRAAYAVQFHLEVTPAMVRDWARANKVEIESPGRPVAGVLLPDDLAERCGELRRLAEVVFSNFVRGGS